MCRSPPISLTPTFSSLPRLPSPPFSGALLLVSKRWQRVLLEDSAVFSTFVLRPCPDRLRGQEPTPEQQGAWLEGQRSFLAQVAPRVHELVVEKGATIQRQANKAAAKQCQVDRQLGLLQPGSLAGLALNYVGSCSKALLAAAARAGGTSLTRLELSTRLPATVAGVLRALRTLCSLAISCDLPKDTGVLQAILTLTRLTSLAIDTLGSSVETSISLLGALSALRQLSISEFAHPPPYAEADLRRLLQRASRLELLSYKMTHMAREHAGFEVRHLVLKQHAAWALLPRASADVKHLAADVQLHALRPCNAQVLGVHINHTVLSIPALPCRLRALWWTTSPSSSAVLAATAWQQRWAPCQ